MGTILDVESGEYRSFCNFCGDEVALNLDKKYFQTKDGILIYQDCVKVMSDYFEEEEQ